MIRFNAIGRPIPKGSQKVAERDRYGRRLPHALILPDNPKLKSWERSVGGAALAAIAAHPQRASFPWTKKTPLVALVCFRLRRPGDHHGARGLRPSAPPFPAVKPDVDKLLRAVLDAVTGSVFDDDAQVVIGLGWKVYALESQAPGAETWIAPVMELEWHGVLQARMAELAAGTGQLALAQLALEGAP